MAKKTNPLPDPLTPTDESSTAQPVAAVSPNRMALTHLLDARVCMRASPLFFTDEHIARTDLALKSIDQAISAIRNTHRAMGWDD